MQTRQPAAAEMQWHRDWWRWRPERERETEIGDGRTGEGNQDANHGDAMGIGWAASDEALREHSEC